MSAHKPLATRLRNAVHRRIVESIRLYYIHLWGMRIGEGVRLSLTAKLDRTNPRGVVIGDWTFLTFRSVVLTHDFVNRRHMETKIGSYCFVGCGAVIMPGVTIGDHCIIGANALVREDVPDRCVVVGNPGRIVKRGIDTIRWGMIPRDWEERIPSSPDEAGGAASDALEGRLS